jgi:hypothetical protein
MHAPATLGTKYEHRHTSLFHKKLGSPNRFSRPLIIIIKLRIPSILKDESTGSCICLWKLAVAVATYVSICVVYRILSSFAF